MVGVNQEVVLSSTTHAYDSRGNQISETRGDVTTESTYSVKGEILTLTKKAGDAVLDGIRIAKKEDGTTRHYYYDNGIIAYTEDDTSLSSANIVGPEGQVVGTYRGDNYHVYLKDIQGSTTKIVKQDGSLSSAYEYSDFGETEEITGSSFDNEICYTGAVYDDTTGLYYMNARYYNPENGRFISQDSYRGELNNPAQWHLYAYCANNPVNYVDPSGHDLIMTAMTAASALILAASYMSTPQFIDGWNDFCTVAGNGLSSMGRQLENGLKNVRNWGAAYIQKVTKNINEFTAVVKAQAKIDEKVKNKGKGAKYFEGFLKKSGKYTYVAIGKSLTATKARKRVAAQSNVFAVSKSYALKLAKNFSGVVGPEIDKSKDGVFGYYYHYHVQKRKNKAHIWYAL